MQTFLNPRVKVIFGAQVENLKANSYVNKYRNIDEQTYAQISSKQVLKTVKKFPAFSPKTFIFYFLG